MAGDLAQLDPPRRPKQHKTRHSRTQSLSSNEGSIGMIRGNQGDIDEDPFVSDPRDENRPNVVSSSLVNTNMAPTDPENQNWSFSPRLDRLGEDVSPQNAQGLLSPQACVFVAK